MNELERKRLFKSQTSVSRSQTPVLKTQSSVLKKIPSVKIKTVVKTIVRNDALKSLEDLVQCGICLEKLEDPRMLPCQHTFCYNCLQKQLMFKEIFQNQQSVSPNSKATLICCFCQNKIELEHGVASLGKLPKNLHVESLLKLMEEESSPQTPKSSDNRCAKCQTVSTEEEHVCQHCMQVYCAICWSEHVLELDANLSFLIKQIEESGSKLKHKAEAYSNRCAQLTESIKESVEQKINSIRKMEKEVLQEVEMIKSQQNIVFENINNRIGALIEKIEMNVVNGKSGSKVSTYMNLHRETAKLFNEIYHFGEAKLIFDPEKFQIDQATEGIYNDIEENELAKMTTEENPFESVNSMVKHYKSRSFTPKLVWTKCPRPGGIDIPPWDPCKIYIAATDSQNLLIFDKLKNKVVDRINNPEMLCPSGLAFSKVTKEIFVTDKWKHSVHVFSSDGNYLRNGCKVKLQSPEDVVIGPNEELIVCDTGHNRILILDSKTGDVLNIIGKGTLSIPTSVTISGNNIIVADSGNNRVKVFDLTEGLLREIGTVGSGKGQFRSPEVVAVDCLGFILVGDAGNARIQVFQPDGTFVKILGHKEGFQWISGIHVTSELDIITTDRKARSLRIF